VRIRVFDTETSADGFPPDAGVCELGWTDVVSTGVDLIERPCGWKIIGPESMLVNPGHPISPQTSAIHHIVDEDVAHAPPLPEAWRIATAMPVGETIDYLSAHSAKFERRFISDEMTGGLQWIDTYKGALRIWPDLETHSNQGIRYARRPDGLDRELARFAHRAGPDSYVTAFHLRDLLEAAEIADLVKWSGEPALQTTCHIGKQRGMKWRDVDDGFLEWVIDKDFDEDVIFTVRIEIERRAKERAREIDELRQPEFAEREP
jgi:exodeoxyribonuclease X